MSTITKEFTREQLQQIEAAAKEVMWPVVWSEKKAREHFSEKITPKVVLELARIALASLEAEAVCVIDQSNLDYLKSGADADVWPASRKEMGDVLLYRTAPPAPANAEPVAWLWSHRKHPSEVSLIRPEDDERAEGAHWSGWSCQALYAAPPAPVSVPDGYRLQPISEYDAMCAAMLQGADGKPELTVWYGAMPESNGKANWTAILHRKGEGRCMNGFTIDRSEYPGRVLYAADRVRYLIGEKSERPSILDYDADAHSGYMKTGNSPVIPDGWVACSERMPDKGQNVLISVNFDSPLIEPLICSARYTGSTFRRGDVTVKPGEGVEEVTHWMPLPAAPQQEGKW